MDRQSVEQKIYKLVINSGEACEVTKYVKFKLTNCVIKQTIETIVQIQDISDSIMYTEIKDMSEFLEIVNACISHELRNPLNSITAQTFIMKVLITKLKAILESI